MGSIQASQLCLRPEVGTLSYSQVRCHRGALWAGMCFTDVSMYPPIYAMTVAHGAKYMNMSKEVRDYLENILLGFFYFVL